MDNKHVPRGYSKKLLHNDILFSYMYIAHVKRDRGKLILKASSLSADILLCTFEIDRGKVYHLI